MAKVMLRCDRCEKVLGYAETPCKFYPDSNVISKYESHESGYSIYMGNDGKFKHLCFPCERTIHQMAKETREYQIYCPADNKVIILED